MPIRLGRYWMTFAAIGLLLAGCTRITAVYNHLDTLFHLQLSRYVDLDKPQMAELDRRFDRLWRWHRSTQLPLYAREARDVRQAAAAPFSSAQVQVIADRLREQAQVSTIEALQASAALLVSLNDAQVTALLAAIEKRAAKEKRKQQKLDHEEWAEQRADEAIKRLDEWAGSVTPAQRQRIQQWSQQSKRPPLDEQAPRRRAFAELLHQRHAADFPQRWERYGLGFFSAEVQSQREPQRRLTQQLLADLSQSATPAQRSYLQEKLASLATELDTLAKGPPS